MTLSRATAGKSVLVTVAAAFAAAVLMFSCATPAFAKEDPGWEQNGYTAGDENGGASSGEGAENGGEPGSADEGNGSSHGGTAEQGFTTPGNADLGDQIKNSGGKDFYTIRTKNNNIFYMVIDHANSSENVYMLSLIDEDDLAEFLKEGAGGTSQTAASPVIIPETKPQTETSEENTETTKEKQPAGSSPLQSSILWILIAAAAGGGAFYYFKVYKAGQEEETDDREGMETGGDGFETEEE